MIISEETTDHETFEGMTPEEIELRLAEMLEEDKKLTEWPKIDRY